MIKHIINRPAQKAAKMKGMVVVLVALLTFSSLNVLADNVQFTATAKTTVKVGEQFQLQYKLNAEGSGFRGPKISDFQVLTGPNTSTNQSVQIDRQWKSNTRNFLRLHISAESGQRGYVYHPSGNNQLQRQTIHFKSFNH